MYANWMRSRGLAHVLALLVYIAVVTFGVNGQATYFVDDGGDDTNLGTEASPWQTISYAVNQVQSGDTIKVKPGTYDVSLGESFPITVPDGVLIEGSETAQANWPRIGGDAGGVDSLMRIYAVSSDLEDVALNRLYFLGENTANTDAPVAVHVRVASGQVISRSGMTNCYVERPEMNDSTTADRAAILIEAGATTGSGFTIDACEIEASERGGIEMTALPTSTSSSNMSLVVRECTVSASGSDTADFGILVGGGDDAQVFWSLSVTGTEVNCSQVTTPGTHGFVTGIDLFVNATNDKTYKFSPGDLEIVACEIHGCRGDGLRIRLDSDLEESSRTNCVPVVERNFIHDTGLGSGAGVHLDWNDLGTEGYIRLDAKSNLIVDNEYGYYFDGFTAQTAGQKGCHTNDTIAGNELYAFYFDGVFASEGAAPAPAIDNCVVWDNNGGGGYAQHYGGSPAWDPCDASGMTHTDWMNLLSTTNCTGGDANIDEDPEFSDASNGDYHLTADSTDLIDAGANSVTQGLSLHDVDGDDRTIDGGSGSAIVDMGADEYDP